MKEAEYVGSNGKTYAIVIRKDIEVENVKFFTKEHDTLQVGMHKKVKDSVFLPHLHKKISRTIDVTEEFLYIISGRVSISIYDENKKKIKEVVLDSGDSVLFTAGGHGIKILEDTRIIEVKQGPYTNVKDDKEKFEAEE